MVNPDCGICTWDNGACTPVRFLIPVQEVKTPELIVFREGRGD